MSAYDPEQTCRRAHFWAPSTALLKMLEPLVCTSPDLLGSQNMISFIHKEVVWMFRTVFFKLFDTS
jgi:hypothetical protein